MGPRPLVAEGLGTALLLFVIVASGIVAETLTPDAAVQLSVHAIVVGAGLAVLIVTLAPVSGAHFNPAVSLAFAMRRRITWVVASAYTVCQILGAVVGVMLANAMFGLPWIELSTKDRSGFTLGVSEFVATFVLVLVIIALLRSDHSSAIPAAVGAWVTVIIFATPSTGFANPAVTLARTLTDTFTGIAPESVPLFLAAEVIAGAAAAVVAGWLVVSSTSGD